MSIILHNVNDVSIEQRESDGYLNATAMSKAHFASTGQRRDVSHWLANERVQESIENLSLKTGIPVFKIVEAKAGRYGGTYIHPRLCVRFAMWLSDDFGLMVEQWVMDWMTGGKAPTIAPEFDIDKELKQIEKMAKVASSIGIPKSDLKALRDRFERLVTLDNEAIAYPPPKGSILPAHHHLRQFAEDTGLVPADPDQSVYVGEIWEQLLAWYAAHDVVQVGMNGKLNWNPNNVYGEVIKGSNQVTEHILKAFPSAKKGKKNVRGMRIMGLTFS